ncbi:hypothetical protein B484DRAFT_409426 [Ochromonadaceae sp. CCMP2298]|nr:hypothetical protein B484DRAFT_409426 [Ochromonadaceae sp. CCMP2298]
MARADRQTCTGLVTERWKDVVSAAGGDTMLIFMGGAEGCISKHPSGPEWTAAAARTIKGDAQAALEPPRSSF